MKCRHCGDEPEQVSRAHFCGLKLRSECRQENVAIASGCSAAVNNCSFLISMSATVLSILLASHLSALPFLVLVFLFASSVSHLSALLFLLLTFLFGVTSIAPYQVLTAWCHSCTTHYMGIARTHSGSDVVLIVHP